MLRARLLNWPEAATWRWPSPILGSAGRNPAAAARGSNWIKYSSQRVRAVRMAKPTPITIPTEPIGSIPRPIDLIERVAKSDSEDPNLAPLYEDASRDTIERFEATVSPIVTDGEQRKYHNFCTYCVHGLPNTAPDGFK